MGTIELKQSLHLILDKIDNEQLLRTIYEFLKERENSKEGQIWNTLTEDQKKQVYLSYQESEDESTLKSWKDIKNKY